MNKKIVHVCFALCFMITAIGSAVNTQAKTAVNEQLFKAEAFQNPAAFKNTDFNELLKDRAQVGKKRDIYTGSLEVKVGNLKSTDNAQENRGLQPQAARLANSYDWDYATTAFNPNSTYATNDIDIIWNQFAGGKFLTQYDILDTGLGSIPTKRLTGTSTAAYNNSVNEGRVNDFIGARVPHQYYTTIYSREMITIMNSSKVRTAVYNDAGQLCFDSGYNSDGARLAPQAFLPTMLITQSTATVFGSAKTMFNLIVPPDNYYIMQLPYSLNMPAQNNIDTLDNTYHYAFYVGKALPKLQLLSTYLDYGTVNPYISQTLTTTISLRAEDIIEPLYAVKRVRVDDVSFQHEYNMSTHYMYFSPNQTYDTASEFNQYYMSAPFMTPGYLEDPTPVPGSMIGIWSFFFRHTIPTRPIFTQTGILNIEYFIPFGMNI